jgi:hypothetical protein
VSKFFSHFPAFAVSYLSISQSAEKDEKNVPVARWSMERWEPTGGHCMNTTYSTFIATIYMNYVHSRTGNHRPIALTPCRMSPDQTSYTIHYKHRRQGGGSYLFFCFVYQLHATNQKEKTSESNWAMGKQTQRSRACIFPATGQPTRHQLSALSSS